MKDISIAKSYDDGARYYASTWKDVHPWLQRARKEVERYIRPNMNVLEIGFGAGRDLAYLRRMGLQVTGIDISKEMVKLAAAEQPEVRLIHGDFRTANLPLGAFDLVWASYSLLHIKPEEFDAALLRVANLLSASGLLFLTMSISDQTIWRFVPVAGLADKEGKPVPVWNGTWNVEDLTRHLEKRMTPIWSEAVEGG